MAERVFNRTVVRPALLCALGTVALCVSTVWISRSFLVPGNSRQVPPSKPSKSALDPASGLSFLRGGRDETIAAPSQIAAVISRAIPALTRSGLGVGAGPLRPSARDLGATLLDESLALRFRRQAAWELAKICDDESIVTLHSALARAASHLKSGIGEALGQCPHPKAREIIASLLGDADEVAVRGAIRALAATGDPQSVETLKGILFDNRRSESVRAEAALALGDVDTPEAYRLLVEAIGRVGDEEMAEQILGGLGRMSFDTTEAFFRNYLASPTINNDLRVAAIEALGDASGNPAPFLLEVLRDRDPQVRAAAGWSLGMLDISENMAQTMTTLLTLERDPGVRLRISQALEGSGHWIDER